MIGNKLEIKGNAVDGPLNAGEYDDRITLIVFFSLDNRSSQVIARLSEMNSELRALGVKGLAVATANHQGPQIDKIQGLLSQLEIRFG